MFLGSFDPQTLFFIIETPKRPYLMRKHAFWAINGRDRSSGVTCRCEQEYKKKWNTKSNGKCPPYADPLCVIPYQPKFACGVVSRISFLVSSFIKIGWKMWELWRVKISAFPLTWHITYTTGCCYRTSRDNNRRWNYCYFKNFTVSDQDPNIKRFQHFQHLQLTPFLADHTSSHAYVTSLWLSSVMHVLWLNGTS